MRIMLDTNVLIPASPFQDAGIIMSDIHQSLECIPFLKSLINAILSTSELM